MPTTAARHFASFLLAACLAGTPAAQQVESRPPNVVVIFIDDLGYLDIGPFGGDIPTPNLDRMAAEGRRFTDFVASTAVCSASRASILTGCYNVRLGIHGAFGPRAQQGIHEDEVTLAEICRAAGYKTACYGKWHLGHHPKFLPLQHGFDDYFGLPYSNDMWPLHPDYAHLPTAAERRKRGYPALPLIEGNEVVDREVSGEVQAELTTLYTERAVAFIEANHKQPFFLYVPHSMVHVPLFVSDKFAGKSGKGLFGDVVMEVDWSVGQILDAIEHHGLARDTLVLFTSDNGPWLSYGDHAGSALPLREGKGTMWEGGYREPTIAWWPDRIPAGTTCDELASTIDILPTVAELLGADLPDHTIDGKDIAPLLFGEEGARSPHDAFYCYYGGGQLQAVRDRRYKLVFPHRYRTMAGKPGGSDGRPNPYSHRTSGLELYDLREDISESNDIAEKHPEIVARLQQHAERARDELGDTLNDRQGSGVRPVGKLDDNDARLVW
jgi:arylsulfatase A